MSTLLSVRTDEAVVDKLDQIAESLDRNRNWVINDAISKYIEMHEWQLAEMKKGRADTEAGRTITTDELRARMAKRHATRAKK
jgi:RHH-type transcriptional regulator, rel operon repressor / antitoxin RelB